MNGETQNEIVTQRVWQVAFGVAYAALFFFLFVVRPAPEQRLRASIGISASQVEVNRLLNHSTPIRTLLSEDLAALLLTKNEGTHVIVVPDLNPSGLNQVVLTVETHWQVRGGLIGRALDQIVGRPARAEALTESLRSVKMRAEMRPERTSSKAVRS